MRPGLKTTLAAVAMAANAAAFCSGTAHAFTFLPGGGPGQPPPGSFTVDDKLFDNFTCTAAGTLCGGVSYLPAPGGALGPEFNPSLAQFGPGTQDVLLEFRAAVVGGAARITDFHLGSNAAFNLSGVVTDTLEICRDAACTSHIIGPLALTAPPDLINFNVTLPDGPYSVVWIKDNVGVTVPAGGLPGSFALISSLDKIVTEVPEPASLAILGVSLLGMGAAAARRRFRK